MKPILLAENVDSTMVDTQNRNQMLVLLRDKQKRGPDTVASLCGMKFSTIEA